MNAAGRAEAAREEAAKIINSLRPDERAAIITSDENTKTLMNFSRDRTLLLSAVERFKPGFGGIDYKKLLIRADEMIRREMSGAKGNIYLISDFQQSGLMPGFDTVSPVKLLPVGKELDTNSYIRDVTPGKQVRNIELDSTEIIEDSNGSRAISKDVVLATPEGVANGIEWKTEQKSICGQAGVSTPDAFKEDNTRYFCFDLPQIVERGRVLLVDSQSDSAVYFRAALDSADSELPDGFDLNSQGSLDEVRDHLSEYKLIIWSVHGVPQAEEIEALRRYYENGGAILFSLSADLNLNRWNEFLEDEEARWLPFKTLSRLTADEEKAARLRIEITDPAATPFRAISDG
ncbi:MAG: VWA domain-containing protein, partial [Pyrinomonadaceae bacterium]